MLSTANQELGLLPAPQNLIRTPGTVQILDGATISSPPLLFAAARLLRRTLEDATGLDLGLIRSAVTPGTAEADNGVGDDAGDGDIRFTVDPAVAPGGYHLWIRSQAPQVTVTASDLAGAHNGVQTLLQLAGPQTLRRASITQVTQLELPICQIEDAPRFAWRGVLLDVARRFWSKHEVLRLIDLMALHHLNVLQLHLTDDQGWRFEVTEYPLLTEVGGWRSETVVGPRTSRVYDGRPHGGFYTREDLREIAAYARARGVELVPEIDLPGHSMAAITAYPWLASNPNEITGVWRTWGISDNIIDPSEDALDFFRTIIDQLVADLNPKFVAIGGDEVPMRNWANRPDIVQRAIALGLTNANGEADLKRLEGWFIGQLAQHITNAGCRAVVWDDCIGPEIPTDAVVTVWHLGDLAEQILRQGYDVVLAPENVLYFDYPQSDMPEEPVHFGKFTSLDDVYQYEPVTAAASSALAHDQNSILVRAGQVLGIQAQLWVEYLNDMPMREYNLFPRLSAFSEVAWTQALTPNREPGSSANQEFRHRLAAFHLPRLATAGVSYRPLNGPHNWQQWPGYITKEKPLFALINRVD